MALDVGRQRRQPVAREQLGHRPRRLHLHLAHAARPLGHDRRDGRATGERDARAGPAAAPGADQRLPPHGRERAQEQQLHRPAAGHAVAQEPRAGSRGSCSPRGSHRGGAAPADRRTADLPSDPPCGRARAGARRLGLGGLLGDRAKAAARSRTAMRRARHHGLRAAPHARAGRGGEPGNPRCVRVAEGRAGGAGPPGPRCRTRDPRRRAQKTSGSERHPEHGSREPRPAHPAPRALRLRR